MTFATYAYKVFQARSLREVREEFLEWRPEAEIILQGDTEPVLVMGQKAPLRALFRSLLQNGSNHLGDNALTVSLTDRRACLELSAEVDGPGFPATGSAHLFDPFVHPDGWQQGGTGLGLAVAKIVVELHCGLIELLNRLNGGRAVRVTLPVRARGAPHRNIWQATS